MKEEEKKRKIDREGRGKKGERKGRGKEREEEEKGREKIVTEMEVRCEDRVRGKSVMVCD